LTIWRNIEVIISYVNHFIYIMKRNYNARPDNIDDGAFLQTTVVSFITYLPWSGEELLISRINWSKFPYLIHPFFFNVPVRVSINRPSE
jgi:hypothetical protein